MKDQILTSTKNIIKYVSAHAFQLHNIFKKLMEKKTNNAKLERLSNGIMRKFLRLLAEIQKYACDKDCHKADKIYKSACMLYKVFSLIEEEVKLCDKEKKIIKAICSYLYCIMKLIKKICEVSESDKTSSSSSDSTSDEECKPPIDKCHLENLKCDKNALCSAVKQLNCVSDMFDLLKVIVVMLQKHFVDQINNANGYSSTIEASAADVDMSIKVLDMYSSQFISIVDSHCGDIFTDTGETITIYVCVAGKKMPICTIDNIKASVEVLDTIKSFVVQVGATTGISRYIVSGVTYGEVNEVSKNNISELDKVIKALDNNQKLIIDCLSTVRKFMKHNLLN